LIYQAVKFECYHTSALARLLLEKSVVSVRIAHHLYWSVYRSSVIIINGDGGCGQSILQMKTGSLIVNWLADVQSAFMKQTQS